MPVHGESRHLRACADLGDAHRRPARTHRDRRGRRRRRPRRRGRRITGAVPCGYVYVDGLCVGDVTEASLKDRRILGDEGFVSVFVVVDAVHRQGRRRAGDLRPRLGHRRRRLRRRAAADRGGARPGRGRRHGDPHQLQQLVRRTCRAVGERHLPPPSDDHPGGRRGSSPMVATVDEVPVRRLLSALEDMRRGSSAGRLPETRRPPACSSSWPGPTTRWPSATRGWPPSCTASGVRRDATAAYAEQLDGGNAHRHLGRGLRERTPTRWSTTSSARSPRSHRVIEGRRRGRPLPAHRAAQTATLPLRGEFLRIGRTVNAMVDQLTALRRGGDPRRQRGGYRRQPRRLGRRARRRRHWRDLTDIVNSSPAT